MKSFFVTDRQNWAALFLRLSLGSVILVHGLQKAFGWFGGPGFENAMKFLSMMAPSPVAFLVILGESIGAAALIAGLCTRFCAASIAVIMTGALLLVHLEKGFFMGNGGYEFHLLAIGMAIALVFTGGGALSADSLIGKKK